MARNFKSNNKTKSAKERMMMRIKYESQAFDSRLGLGREMVMNNHFVERLHYGMIDHENNSVIPDEQFLVETQNGRVFDFVADSYALMRLNWTTAVQRGLVSLEGSAFGNLKMIESYVNPRLKYGEYLGSILQRYNETHIPNIVGINNITSYEDYVKNFFKYILKKREQAPITMTRWNTSTASNILDTGLAFSYAEISMSEDQMKIDKIIDHPSFDYFQNLCMNMGFAISKENPNILICELKSPANDSIRYSYGLFTLSDIFNNRFIKTYTIDNLLLYNNINIYYNNFARKNYQTRITEFKCGRTVSRYILRSQVRLDKRPYTDAQELELYCKLRNFEEGSPFEESRIKNICRKAKYLLKTVDKQKALGYINKEFKDQVWNKNYGFHDLKAKIKQRATEIRSETVGASPSSGGTSSSY